MTSPPPAPPPAHPPDPFDRLPGSRWQVQLLGGLRLRSGDVELPGLPDHPTLLLFVHLALQPQAAHSRDVLAEAIWPNVPDKGGLGQRADAVEVRRERLRKTLSKLRGAFNAAGTQHVDLFPADRDTIGLNAAAFDIDVQRFKQHILRRQ